jgi:hypothetical protein
MQHKLILMLLILLTGCTAAGIPDGANTPVPSSTAVLTPGEAASSPIESSILPVVRNRRVAMEDNYSFALSLGFDSIRPIYSPEFASAAEAPLDDEELVLGIAWGGEAKAYPISVLRFREMVDDEMAGIPTLVTW